ncbi:MAG TPA: VCBS repeat-containing protein [Symbiobacteriaceae bacterium]
MRVDQSGIVLTSNHSQFASRSQTEKLEAWVGDRPPAPRANRALAPVPAPVLRRDTAEISPEARQAMAALQIAKATGTDSETDPLAGLSPQDRNRVILLERVLGIKIKIMRPQDFKSDGKAAPAAAANTSGSAEAPQKAGWGFVYEAHQRYEESEQLSFTAQGVINTTDGKQINVSVAFNMSRQFQSESNLTIRGGDALIKDPLVINYAGPAAGLSQQTMTFDLDSDGKPDLMPLLNPGSGYLALDQNGDGTVNNGSELFGPASGNGFADLAQHDADHNNWIDENDPIYQKLRIWTKDAAGNDQLFALGQLGIGAIYLGGIDAPFTLKDGGNQTTGQVQQMSVFARENGTVGTVQQLDVVLK